MKLRKLLAVSGVVLATALSIAPAYAKKAGRGFASEDEAFLALRDAARSGDSERAQDIAAALPQYVIPSYVDYYRLRSRLSEASEEEIRAFLTRYEGNAIADRLRNDWLLELGRTRQWKLVDEQYPLFVLNDDTQVKCYALTSRALKGQNVTSDARAVLVNPKEYGEACANLIVVLADNGQFSSADVDAQVRLAGEFGLSSVIKRLAGPLGLAEAVLVPAVDKPEYILKKGPGTTAVNRTAFTIALGRVAHGNLPAAISALKQAEDLLSADQKALAWAAIALQASYRLVPESNDYWHKAEGASLSNDALQWRVRAALRAGDWKQVKLAVDAMPATMRSDPAWAYWRARALKANGQTADALAVFQDISNQINFYGQLAAEELGRKIVLPPRPAPLTPAEIEPMASNAGFARSLKFIDLNLRFEANREWNWELRKMNERQHLAAAEFARQHDVLDRMVNTSDRTRTEMDFTQRFPTPYIDQMKPVTDSLGLDMAWVYGLIRQESRFVMNARSNVGASGLMQVMPATARYVARKIGLTDFSTSQISDVHTNIVLGTNYLNLVLNDLEGSQALASAAYNAGPGRPRAWRSTLTRPVEGAIFAETIPFNETRVYVKNVLSNATYYAALLDGQPQSLKSRLGVIAPKAASPSDIGDPNSPAAP